MTVNKSYINLLRSFKKIFEGDDVQKTKMTEFIKLTIRENLDKDENYIKNSIDEFRETMLKNFIQVRKLSDGRPSAYVNRSELTYLIEHLKDKNNLNDSFECCQKIKK